MSLLDIRVYGDPILRKETEVVTEVRIAAIGELGALGPDADQAVPVLQNAAQDAKKTIREAASEARTFGPVGRAGGLVKPVVSVCRKPNGDAVETFRKML